MLLHPVIEQLKTLKLHGMIDALQNQNIDVSNLSFEERLGLLVAHEISVRESKRVQKRLRAARLKTNACLEDINFKPSRRLDKSLVVTLETCEWLKDHRNVLITGATGTGKSYLAEALVHKACLKGFTAISLRMPRFLDELIQARAEGGYSRKLVALSKIDLLILDDFGLCPLTDQNRRDFLEVLDDRYKKRSTIITSQLEVKNWHAAIGDATLADAILDRVIHNSYRFELQGDTLRKEEQKKREASTN